MNTSLSDDEFDGLLADDERQDEKTYMQRIASMPRWKGKPWQLRELFIFHPALQCACLFANVIGLAIIAFSFSFVLPAIRNTGNQCELPTDSLLEHKIGWRTITWEDQPRYVGADPDGLDTSHLNIWSEIYPSSWIWVHEPAKYGYGGGVKLADYAVHPSEFEETTEGFAISVMHQVHCVAELKRSLIHYRRDGLTTIPDEHLDHCVEYLRQAVMCHADMTLERPENMTFPQGSTGWGDMHRCRNWDDVLKTIQDHSIGWVDNGREKGWKKRKFVDGKFHL
ncbi:hypothetical protein BGZ60DRAFT_186443 [Tricladium varicosporioides]|nr:hypothetical protein BGZ60DRAFT_186443 [Hymenoscyphus varicosporioides]